MDPVTPPADPTPGAHRTPGRIGFVVTIAGDLLVVVGAFLPWVVSGEARRDSFATVRAAQRIGVVGMPVWEAVLSVWFLAPLLAALVLVGLAFERRWLQLAGGVALAVLAIGFGALVVLAPVQRGVGPVVVLVGGGLLLAGIVLTRPGRAPRRAATADPGAVPL